MKKMKSLKKIKEMDNNRGSSLLIIISVFALLIVLCTNMLMAARASTTSLSAEIDSDDANVYVSSVFQTINNELTKAGSQLGSANIFTTQSTVTFEYGFVEKVTLLGKSDYTAEYIIPYKGRTYTVTAVYKKSNPTSLLYVKDIVSEK